MITAGVSRLSKDPDRTSTGSTQSTGNSAPSLRRVEQQPFDVPDDNRYAPPSDKESSPAVRRGLQSALPGNNPFEVAKAEEEEEEGFLEPDLPYPATEDGRGGDPSSLLPSRADEALKTCEMGLGGRRGSEGDMRWNTCSLFPCSGSVEAGVGDSAHVTGSRRAKQTLHRGPSAPDHLAEDPRGQVCSGDGPQRLGAQGLPDGRPRAGPVLGGHGLLRLSRGLRCERESAHV